MTDHKQKVILVNGKEIEVDEKIADIVEKINARSISTSFSCQGSPKFGGMAYIVFRNPSTKAVKRIRDIAWRAGFEANDRSSLAVYAIPGIHQEAIREVAQPKDYIPWNEKFLLFLSDIANDTLDESGERYHVSYPIHDCAIVCKQSYVDKSLMPAYRKWKKLGGKMSVFCQGDTKLHDRKVVSALVRWTLPKTPLPKELIISLVAIGFEFEVWGVFTFRKNVIKRDGYGIRVSNERLLAMNMTFRTIFADYANDLLKEPSDYVAEMMSTQRRLKATAPRASSKKAAA